MWPHYSDRPGTPAGGLSFFHLKSYFLEGLTIPILFKGRLFRPGNTFFGEFSSVATKAPLSIGGLKGVNPRSKTEGFTQELSP